MSKKINKKNNRKKILSSKKDMSDFYGSNKQTLLAIIFILGIVFTLLPNLIRLNNSTPVAGQQPYYIAKTSKIILDNPYIKQNPQIFEPQKIIITPYTYLFGLLLHFTSMSFASIFLPFFLSLLSLFLFYKILDRVCNFKDTFFILLVFVLSPPYIYLGSNSSPYSLLVLLDLLFIYILMLDVGSNETKTFKSIMYKVIMLGIFITLIFFSLFNILLVLILLYSYIFIMSNFKKKNTVFLLFIIIAGLYFIFISQTFYTQYETLLVKEKWSNIFTEFGSYVGISIFAFILGLSLLFIQKMTKMFLVGIYTFLFMILSLYFISQEINILFNFLICLFAGITFSRITSMKWTIDILKFLTIFIILSGLLFSLITYEKRIINAEPTREIATSLRILSSNTGLLLTHNNYAFYVQYYTNLSVVTNPYTNMNSSIRNVVAQIFAEKDSKEALKMLNSLNVDYIWVNNKMRNGLVWEKPNTGLDFALRDSEIFKKVYDNGDIRIYRVE